MKVHGYMLTSVHSALVMKEVRMPLTMYNPHFFSYLRAIIVAFEAKKFIKDSWFTHKVMLFGCFMQYKV